MGYCVKWDGDAMHVDKTAISGVRTYDDATMCPSKCSLWGLCTPSGLKEICDEAKEHNAWVIMLGIIAGIVSIFLILFCCGCMCCGKQKLDDDYIRQG